MALRLSPYQTIPPPGRQSDLLEVPISALQPTQLCVGLAEVHSRQRDFALEPAEQRRQYLRRKPVPLVRNAAGDLWMLDRHHRLRALIELDGDGLVFAYIAHNLKESDRLACLRLLDQRGWLYLYDGRGQGPLLADVLPRSLTDLQDDPYRSLVWKLKQESRIQPQPHIPYHEFRWGAWLRSRCLPPFSSARLEPALPAARALTRSAAASHLPGWKGESQG
ncbi:chromosome partitioning protein ParB [Synechococcus sp. RSCCF101]|uniref:ParB-like protein n=1 Tax=Synechococcus sp. RSCCF101 TaxID=2511069 RepID=UPI001249114C|nr:ParB-like protein [Synechococcus sp. RSCCF101]QEY31316.1 chromosome partitioning protein ParB [Synechococcus sp. RSCCF101]